MSQFLDNNKRIAMNSFFSDVVLDDCIIVYEMMFIARMLK